MMMKPRIQWALGVVFVLGLVAVRLSAQAVPSAQPATASTLEALLAEVRALRADINQASSASIRTQLLTARLTLQEQRVYTVVRQLTDVQELLGKVRIEISLDDLQQQLGEQVGNAGPRSVIEDEQLRRQAAFDKLQSEQKQRREQGLRAQETELLNTLNAEQARWAEFNGRLDEIERSLSSSR